MGKGEGVGVRGNVRWLTVHTRAASECMRCRGMHTHGATQPLVINTAHSSNPPTWGGAQYLQQLQSWLPVAAGQLASHLARSNSQHSRAVVRDGNQAASSPDCMHPLAQC